MKTDEAYNKLVKILRNSTPELTRYEIIEKRVMERILNRNKFLSEITAFLFSWIYISWVRRSLVTASFMLLGFFIWQQHTLIDQVNELKNRIDENYNISLHNQSSTIESRQMLMEISRRRANGYYISTEDIVQLLDSLNSVNIRYRDLLKLIEEDPQLRNRLKDKVEKNSGSKLNTRL